jgi:hypothetical protein
MKLDAENTTKINQKNLDKLFNILFNNKGCLSNIIESV